MKGTPVFNFPEININQLVLQCLGNTQTLIFRGFFYASEVANVRFPLQWLISFTLQNTWNPPRSETFPNSEFQRTNFLGTRNPITSGFLLKFPSYHLQAVRSKISILKFQGCVFFSDMLCFFSETLITHEKQNVSRTESERVFNKAQMGVFRFFPNTLSDLFV